MKYRVGPPFLLNSKQSAIQGQVHSVIYKDNFFCAVESLQQMAALQQIECNISHSCQKSELRSWPGGCQTQVKGRIPSYQRDAQYVYRVHRSLKGEGKLKRRKQEKNRLLAKYSRTIANYEGEILLGAVKAWALGLNAL